MRPVLTEEALRSAWLLCRSRARCPWPATFEEAMADATFSRLVRLTALHPPRPPRACIAPPIRPALPLPGAARGCFDRKRAAAGERDDD